MFKNVVKFDHTIDGKTGHFFCDHDTPIPIAKDMLLQFLKYLGQIEDQAKAQAEEQKKAVKPDIEPKE